MHALITDTIPIYWGNPNASQDFNPKAFINCHDFKSFDEVVDLVMEIDQNDNLYKEYLSQPYLVDGKERDFCKEENIVAKFDEIISSNKIYVPVFKKKLQRCRYNPVVWKKTAQKFLRKSRVYGKKILTGIYPINKIK